MVQGNGGQEISFGGRRLLVRERDTNEVKQEDINIYIFGYHLITIFLYTLSTWDTILATNLSLTYESLPYCPNFPSCVSYLHKNVTCTSRATTLFIRVEPNASKQDTCINSES